MYLSFGRRLRGLGGVRFGVHKRVSGGAAAVMLFVYCMMYLMWYMLLGTLWLMYGLGYVCYYLPAREIVKFSKKKKREKEVAEAMQKYSPTPSQADN